MIRTWTDGFAGGGGSSTGIRRAAAPNGGGVAIAFNHWPPAIRTHTLNHPDTEHREANIFTADPRDFPTTDAAWFSPSCPAFSIAKGQRRVGLEQMVMFDELADPTQAEEEASRITMNEVVRFTRHHRYKVVIVENVVEVNHWTHFGAWIDAMKALGYKYRACHLNAQHFGVPQSRDRYYGVFWRADLGVDPDLDFRPDAVCPEHGDIQAVQAWKPGSRGWGKYRTQYAFVCPTCNRVVEPPFVPASSVIDWSIPMERIADRARPLAANTLARIEKGLRRFATGETFLSPYNGNSTAAAIGLPLPTIPTHDRFALIAPPFILPYANSAGPARLTDDVLHTIHTANGHGLVLPPLAADHQPEIDWTRAVAECGYRMLKHRELARAMSFPEGYQFTGVLHEILRQIGNAVCPNVAEWLARCVMAMFTSEMRKVA